MEGVRGSRPKEDGCNKGVPHTASACPARGPQLRYAPALVFELQGNKASERASESSITSLAATDTASEADENLADCALLCKIGKFLSR